MFLEKLEIQGFKSFANPVTLKFDRELAVIVGPNGSGKSNIADAIRWVLGEQSLKLLRGKRGEDVIFSGSDKKTRLGLAEVNLYLNNEDQKAPLDYQQIVISRRIYRNGENEYFLNKNKVRLIDIQLLLASANFGQKTYSVIGQGMIDFILTASLPERREFFDEATGVRQYQIKKEQAINKLITTKENLIQSTNILKEIEPRFRSLHRQIKKLEKRKEFESKLRELQKLYFSKALNDLNKQFTNRNEKLTKFVLARQKIEQIINEWQKKIEQERQTTSREEAFNNLQNQLNKLLHQRNQLEKEKAVQQGMSEIDLIKNGQAPIVWLTNKKTEFINNEKELNEQLKDLTTDYQKKTSNLNEKVKRQHNLLKELKKIEDSFNNYKLNKPNYFIQELNQAIDEIYQLQKKFINNLIKVETVEEIKLIKKAAEIFRDKWEDFYQRIKAIKNNKIELAGNLTKKVNELQSSQTLLNQEISQQKIALTIIEERLNLTKENLKKIIAEKIKIEQELLVINDSTKRKDFISDRLKDLQRQLVVINEEVIKIQEKIKKFNQTEDKKKEEFFQWQQKLQAEQTLLAKVNEEINAQKVEIAKIETHQEELDKKIKENWTGQFIIIKDEIDIDLNATGQEIERLKNQLNLIGGLDESIQNEYEEVNQRYQFLKKEITDLEEAFAGLEKVIEELDKKIKAIFSDKFQKINQSFTEYFRLLFSGGRAKLVLIKPREEINQETVSEKTTELLTNNLVVQSTSPEDNWFKKLTAQQTNYHIEIQAMPPGKRLNSINMLSGGEKALTSIALICAIIKNNPSPFVVLDEVDATLDEANSLRLTKILDELSKHTQFICITHNRATIQKTSILYGVTMGDNGVSKILSLNLKEASQYIKDK